MCRKGQIIKRKGVNVYYKIARVEGNFIYAHDIDDGIVMEDGPIMLLRKSQVEVCTVVRLPIDDDVMNSMLGRTPPMLIRHRISKMWDDGIQKCPDIVLFFCATKNNNKTCYAKYASVSRVLVPLEDNNYNLTLHMRERSRMRYQLNGIQVLN